MAIKVLIKRQYKPESFGQVSALLNRARYDAMGMQGYISSETLTDLYEPGQVVVISMWQSVEDWQKWIDSPKRSEFAAEMRHLMTGPEQIEIYALGLKMEQ